MKLRNEPGYPKNQYIKRGAQIRATAPKTLLHIHSSFHRQAKQGRSGFQKRMYQLHKMLDELYEKCWILNEVVLFVACHISSNIQNSTSNISKGSMALNFLLLSKHSYERQTI